jgi:hypothetical protein
MDRRKFCAFQGLDYQRKSWPGRIDLANSIAIDTNEALIGFMSFKVSSYCRQ